MVTRHRTPLPISTKVKSISVYFSPAINDVIAADMIFAKQFCTLKILNHRSQRALDKFLLSVEICQADMN
jgi:hypothetical protein